MIFSRKRRSLFLFAAAVLFLSACTVEGAGVPSPGTLTQEVRTDLLGTVITISSYESVSSDVFEGVFDLVADLDARMSVNRPDSEISAINSGSGRDYVAVSADTCDLISLALDFSRLSGGAFDISVGPVMALWKSDGEFCRLPGDADIRSRLPSVGYEAISLAGGGILLELDGMMLDLGGIAKGYACDRALDYLKTRGLRSALLDFGGNIYAHGTKPDGALWTVGVKTPLVGENGLVCAIRVQDMSVVTSGGYERFFEASGAIYHHILDPKTGYPADSGLLSVTIVDPSSTRADALSTACFVQGLDAAYALLESQPESEGIFITEDCAVRVTPGLRDRVTLLDTRFTLVDD